jgi:two-component system phosphate regulon response regulator PhoB
MGQASKTSDEGKPHLLVVEDEEALVVLLRYNLEREGYQVSVAMDGDDAIYMAEAIEPDLILLDWMLPGRSGLSICREIRSHKTLKNTPVVMVTARGEERDMIQGLKNGADDYIRKPFSPAELIARVDAVLRRSDPLREADRLEVGMLALDRNSVQVEWQEQPVSLSLTELRLLEVMMERPNHACSRDFLITRVWGENDEVDFRTVDVNIRRLRQALTDAGAPDFVRTVRGVGYALQDNTSS